MEEPFHFGDSRTFINKNLNRESLASMDMEIEPKGTVTTPLGFAAGAASCGLKESGKLDVALLLSDRDCTAAGVFTKNQVVAAPVILDRETLASNPSHMRGVVTNAGIANACTGEQGLEAAREMGRLAAGLFGCQPEQFFVLSTGVIGVQLPMQKVAAGIRLAGEFMGSKNGSSMAQAIMTTDTRSKRLALKLNLPNGVVTIGGVAKGSGMIHPDMATLLAVLTTDAAVPAGELQRALQAAVDKSFNNISVDGDTSTNDTVLLLANGASGVALNDEASLALFAGAVNRLCNELAKMIVHDGEGASKFVEIRVTSAADSGQARQIAETIATSPLVKTALAGSDPNWGRILAAAGRAGVSFDQDQVALWIGNPGDALLLQLVAEGTPAGFHEADAAAIFARPEIDILLDLGQGAGEATMWTTDLTREYVTINADYRT